MNITFSASELKKDELDINKSNFTLCYLIAIKSNNPKLWNTFKNVIDNIDNRDSLFNKTLNKVRK